MSEVYHMWSYWRDKKGYEDALKGYYPETLANNDRLKFALLQIENGKAVIESIMAELSDKEYEEQSKEYEIKRL